MSNMERVKRGFSTNGFCVLCNKDMEDVDHIFRKFQDANEIWRRLLNPNEAQKNRNLSFDKWLMFNLGHGHHYHGNENWNILFAIALWWIWKWRNKFVFHEKRMDVALKVGWIRSQYRDIISAFASKRLCPAQLRDTRTVM